MVNWAGTMGKAKIGEWLWRFLAGVMLFAVGWTVWIYSQLNPPALVTEAAFAAAANAKANAGQSTQGVIAPAPAPETPKEPPVNAEKLKFSESLSAPDKK
jgi:hypothetical protein